MSRLFPPCLRGIELQTEGFFAKLVKPLTFFVVCEDGVSLSERLELLLVSVAMKVWMILATQGAICAFELV